MLRRCKGKLEIDFVQYTLSCIIKGVSEMHSCNRGLGSLTENEIVFDQTSHVKIAALDGLRKLNKDPDREDKLAFYEEDFEKIVLLAQKLQESIRYDLSDLSDLGAGKN